MITVSGSHKTIWTHIGGKYAISIHRIIGTRIWPTMKMVK